MKLQKDDLKISGLWQIAFFVFLLVSAIVSCKPQKNEPIRASEIEPTQQATQIPEPTRPTPVYTKDTLTPTPEATESLPDVPPPSSLIDILEAKTAAGEWRYEDGLILGLKLLAGEVEAQSTFGPVADAAGTGILHEAGLYLHSGGDVEIKVEIERLLAIIVPDFEKLQIYAELEKAQSSQSIQRVSFPANPAVQCADLWWTGRHEEFGVVPIKQQVSYFASHEMTHLPQIVWLVNQ